MPAQTGITLLDELSSQQPTCIIKSGLNSYLSLKIHCVLVLISLHIHKLHQTILLIVSFYTSAAQPGAAPRQGF
jgi:hypothetical protein